MKRPSPRRKPEPTIALINIVFLMLIFFLVAGTIAPPLDPDLTLARTENIAGREPPDALVLTADGVLRFRGAEADVDAYMRTLDTAVARIVPDRDASAARLMEVTLALRAAGASRVMVVAERSLQ
ncbi:biopolymer transport protein ExbD [Yoonia maricola]|uniref:Biopolymer transport protein ExbD n=1 Tax=Yoonia maricola TaxID=420999 RepID=A0A2M8W040_9RHOB|nr:biopolymer transporter ExbD [Yoonia maricola]PJI84282.1 biopolymer transport protein ExbD [Yoonia maricola]